MNNMNNFGGKGVCGAVIALMLSAGPMLLAQDGHEFGRFEGGGGFGTHQPTTGAPYSAVRTTTHLQTLANGTTITHTNQLKEARDSSGRTYVATVPNPAEGERGMHSFTHVFDPVSRESISWSADTKQATVVHLADAGQFHGPSGAGAGETAAGPAAGQARVGRFGGMNAGRNSGVTTESLGSKTINGLVAEGTRTTRVIPAGKMGNSEPLTITHETWFSQDLKIELMRTDTDPRFGTTTVQVTNVDRNEPSAALFQAPAGFAVKERTMGQQRGGGFEAQ
jgi:hypothetical protein